MIGCASSSPPLTPIAVSHRNSPFLGGASAVPFPNPQPPPTLRLPPRRIAAGARAAYASAAAERERESEYTATGGGYSYSSSSSSTSYSYNRISGFAAAAAVSSPSLYDVLGLSPCTTAAEIKAAYRRLARSCHPDASKGEGGASASAEQFMRVHAAYATLSDPEKRAEYDRGLAMSVSYSPGIRTERSYQRQESYPGPGGSTSSASTYSAPTGFQSGFGRRTWETDQCW